MKCKVQDLLVDQCSSAQGLLATSNVEGTYFDATAKGAGSTVIDHLLILNTNKQQWQQQAENIPACCHNETTPNRWATVEPLV